jgi:hypothetical protein
MQFTPAETQIVETLQQRRVETSSRLAEQLKLSTKTVQRALAKVQHFTSINGNGAYVTLKDIPRFDEHGLWTHREVCFSKHGNLRETLTALVERSPAGCTLQELEVQVQTRAHNHVSQLIRDGQLTRFSLGRYAVYLSCDDRRQAKQWTARQQEIRQPSVSDTSPPTVSVPPGLDAVTVIRVLVRRLEAPEASVASVARWLQAREVAVGADQIRQILDFYGLKKTTR